MKGMLDVILLVFINLIPAVAIPVIAAYYQWLTNSEATLLGVLIWVVFTTVETLYKVDKLQDAENREVALWASQNEFDVRLSNMREAYRKILTNKRDTNDLFQSFFDDRTAELERTIVEAANRDELHLERSHVVSIGVLLGSFKGDSVDIFRPVHFLEDNQFFFDIYAKQYFYRVFSLVQEKKIREVKRLMIFSKDEELEDPRTTRLATFHTVTPGYSYRLMRMHDFRSLLRDYRLDVPRDFGIYGDKYVYCAQINVSENIVGYWLRNQLAIRNFIQFFEGCWNSPVAFKLKHLNSTKKMSIDELFEEAKT
jgi:hypothetical protein